MPDPTTHALTFRRSSMGRRAALVTAVLSAALFAGLATVVGAGPLAIDRTVADLLAPLSVGPVGGVIAVVNVVGQALVWDPLVVVLAAILWLRGHRTAAVVLIVGLVASEASVAVAKVVVGRGQPPGTRVFDLVTQASYPSGHVARVAVASGLLVFLAWRPDRHRVAAFAAAVGASVLMGVARIAVGAHWFSDVVGSVLLAACIVAFSALALDLLARRPGATAAAPPREPVTVPH